ncbi:MAG: hypothetical protein NUW07_10090 [Candidatus Saccharicenans sp.]|jgi:hypothetical protein|nr:hypothetical protein [Candidatus Saccharicenans sp.]MDH7493775.1 hypothetical protein [Candidatus Saccharicenans sp.]
MPKKDWWLDLGLFLGTVLLARLERWSASDLVWSLWIASLTLGYSYILVSIAGMLAGQLKKFSAPQPKEALPTFEAGSVATSLIFLLIIGAFTGFFSIYTIVFLGLIVLSAAIGISYRKRGLTAGASTPVQSSKIAIFFLLLPAGLFMVGFFTVHFLGFHFVHSLFLSTFFPLLPQGSAGSHSEFLFFRNLVATSIKSYWVFILASAFSRLQAYRTAFQKTEMGPSVGFAYINVARMHVLIFIIAFLSSAGLQRLFLYPILFLYFFPFDTLLFRGKNRPPSVS